MPETFYVVRRLINGHEGCMPSEFASKDEAIEFINILHRMNDGILDYKVYLYEVKKIDY